MMLDYIMVKLAVSIDHGSIGTHQPRETSHIDRLRMPLDNQKRVWEFLTICT